MTSIAGIAIPNSGFAREATDFLRDTSTRLLFDHSRRVFSGLRCRPSNAASTTTPSSSTSARRGGLLEGHRSEHERFEIDGANAARAFLERHGCPTLAAEHRDAVLAAHPRTGSKTG